MEIYRNIQIEGNHGKPILADVFYKESSSQKPVIIFCHGFKGFKDWGAYNWMARFFAEKRYVFVKFNFSHNGTTPDHPEEFADLEAFGNNNFSIELDDLDAVIDWIRKTPLIPEGQKNLDAIYLIGHSRGGGIAILKAAFDKRIKKLATWASISDFGLAWNEDIAKQWQQDGVMHMENARTKEKMPLYYQLYEDYIAHKKELDISRAVDKITIPFLIVHGTEDETVPFERALEMKRWNQKAKLDLIPHGSHTFGVRHPFDELNLPFDMQVVLEHTEEFFKNNN
jgi:pimeloyl-ACP methyl ester carboxylesterase